MMAGQVAGRAPQSQQRGGVPVAAWRTSSHAFKAASPRPHMQRSAARASAAAAVELSVEQAVSVLRQAADTSSVPATVVFDAMRALEKAKGLPAEDKEAWPAVLGGSATPGRRWRLVFTTGTKQVQEAMKGTGRGGGSYFPLTAVQRWDATASEIENGIYLGWLGALTFKGPYTFEGKKLAFDFDQLMLKLGPLKLQLPLKERIDPKTFKAGPKLPFFLFVYIDETIAVARGRGGGLAVWARTSPQWELQKGVA